MILGLLEVQEFTNISYETAHFLYFNQTVMVNRTAIQNSTVAQA
jgi:hypothetical protein